MTTPKPPPPPRVSKLPEARPISRVLRALLGLAMLALVIPQVLRASTGGQIQVVGVFFGLVMFYTAVHFVVGRYFEWLHPWVGAVVAVMPALAVFLVGAVFGIGAGVPEAGVVLFIGASLVLIAASGQPGCEVLAFPAVLLGKRTHLACLLFSPLDWIEGTFFSGSTN